MKKILKSFLILIFALRCLQAGNLENIKGTYTPLKEEYKQCSPMQGAIWWEYPNLLKNLYMYGEIKLIKELFYLAQGNFADTHLERKTAFHLSPEIIGQIVGILVLHEIELKNMRTQKEKEAHLGEIKKRLPELIRLRVSQDKYFKKSNEQTALVRAALQQEVLALKKELDVLKDEDKGPLIEQIKKKDALIFQKETDVAQEAGIKELSSGIYELFRECFWEKQLPCMTTDVLLAFLYKKDFVEDGKIIPDREKFKRYFKALEEYIQGKTKESIFLDSENNPLIGDGWLVEKYQITDVESIRGKIKGFVETKKDIRDIIVNELLKIVTYEDIVYAEGVNRWYLGALPKIAGFKHGVKYKDKDFPDCMETVIRNLCDIILYDQNSRKFDLSKAIQPNNKLKDFYAKYLSPDNVELEELNDSWTNVVENIDGVMYRLVAKEGNPVVYGDKIIRIDDMMLKQLGDIKQTDSHLSPVLKQIIIVSGNIKFDCNRVISDDYFVFNMVPSLRNLIVVLNTVLGLGLYKDLKETFAADFNNTYFTKLCEKLGWEYYCNKSLDKDVDLTIKITKGKCSFTIEIRSGHGEITGVIPREQEAYEKKLFERLNKKDIRNIPLVLLYNDYMQKTYEQISQAPLFIYNLFPIFCLELSDDEKLELIKSIIKIDQPKEMEINLVKSFIKNTPLVEDLNFHSRLIDLLGAKSVIFKQELSSFFNKLIKPEAVSFDKIAQPKLLNKFVEQGLVDDYSKLVKIAFEDFKNQQSVIAGTAVLLYSALFEKGQGYKEAIANVGIAVKSQDKNVRLRGLKLLGMLVDKGQGYKEAMAAAWMGIKDKDPGVRLLAFQLYKKLVEKGQAYEKAIEAAGIGINDHARVVRKEVLGLYVELVKRGQAYEGAKAAARIGIKDNDEVVCGLALDIYAEFVRKGEGTEEAMKAARDNILIDDFTIKSAAIGVYSALVEVGVKNIYQEAITVARKNISSKDNDIKCASLRLYKALVERGQKEIFKEAIDSVHEYVQSGSDNVKKAALELRNALKK